MNQNESKVTMTSRERVQKTLNFEPVDRVPIDLGSMPVTGAHVSIIAKLRKAYGFADEPIKVCEPYQMLGRVPDDLREVLELDVVDLPGTYNLFGFKNEDWKPWRTFDGTDVLVPGKFNTEPEPNGEILQYPQGDKTVRPSGKMPKGGFYFDSIINQEPIDESKLDPADNLEDFSVMSDEDLKIYEQQANDAYENTDSAISMVIPGAAFGDIALVPAPWLKNPRGIRAVEEWYVSTVIRKDYITEVFASQAEIAIKNLANLYQAVGNKVQIAFMDGADFSSQQNLFCSPDGYRELYMPHTKKLNDWIHDNTEWKTFKHCCGCCESLIDVFIEAGYDILNPVQTSAAGMDPELLVEKYGGRIVFWGGGVDTQQTLPFGTPEEVYEQVSERLEIFNRKSGFVFNPIHNIQYGVSTENLLAMFRALGRKTPS